MVYFFDSGDQIGPFRLPLCFAITNQRDKPCLPALILHNRIYTFFKRPFYTPIPPAELLFVFCYRSLSVYMFFKN